MATVQRLGWGLVGAGTTMLARRVVRALLYKGDRPRLAPTTRHDTGVPTLLLFAAASGVALAIADMLQDQRKYVAQRAAH